MQQPTRNRRFFIQKAGLATFALASQNMIPMSQSENWTIQQIIDGIMGAIPGSRRNDTVDTFKSGNPTNICTGIVTTFLATAEVIKRTAELGANLIITHEPTYYNHLDETDWLEEDPVYQAKLSLIENHKIAIWRFHDYWHQHRPDGILQGFLELMNWTEYVDGEIDNICNIPEMTLQDLANTIKQKMDLHRPFLVGEPALICNRVGLLLGAGGGRMQIGMLSKEDMDVLVVGEVAEWETCEYIRDSNNLGMHKGLIVLGHAVSEEPGMAYLANWLTPRFKGLSINHVPATEPFRLV